METSVSKKSLWIGRIVSGLPALFLLVDGAMKLVKPAVVVDATTKLGYSESVIVPIGIRFNCLHDSLFDSSNVGARCDSVDRLSRRRRGDARASW